MQRTKENLQRELALATCPTRLMIYASSTCGSTARTNKSRENALGSSRVLVKGEQQQQNTERSCNATANPQDLFKPGLAILKLAAGALMAVLVSTHHRKTCVPSYAASMAIPTPAIQKLY